VEEPEEKRKALSRIMAHNTGRENWEFPDGALNATCVYKLEVEELSCKEHE
jgi:nitroimidazol reductase NimA-like FMN-containing flavoprotein (pyridoxamine 5'-phosphate oxidase superfamily)